MLVAGGGSGLGRVCNDTPSSFPLSVEDIDATDNATTEMEPLRTQLKPRPFWKSAPRKVGAITTTIQEMQTPMPLSKKGIGPPPPDSLTATQGMLHQHFLHVLFFAPYTDVLIPYHLAYCKFETISVHVGS